MLLAVPSIEPLTPEGEAGRQVFEDAGCGGCHAPRLEGPRGPLPVYSDLLLHDMGDALADDIDQGEASGREFRTQPLWGVSAVGPYLHDGRAETLLQAILLHGGEAQAARDRVAARPGAEQAQLVAFLMSLGGRDQYSPGLVPMDEPAPDFGAWGGPVRAMSGREAARFEAGRRLFDRERGLASGLGAPRFNGDSCRACHFEPVLGGAGPLGVNVMRHGIANAEGRFVPPAVGTILHRETALIGHAPVAQAAANVFEPRQTPHLFGLGLIDALPEAVIMANADPDDAVSADGITGRVSYTDDGRVGRFGWKAQVPSLAEFVRDAFGAELGMTVAYQPGLTFGRLHDEDAVADPEVPVEEAELMRDFLAALGPPPRAEGDVQAGLQVFEATGCAACHIPALEGPGGAVPLFSDLLLHEILPTDAWGVEDTSANMREFRTAPLWGLRETAPYWHTGEAETVEAAILLHEGEGRAAQDAFRSLSTVEKEALLAFLGTL